MCMGVMQPAKAPPKAPPKTGARNMGFPTVPSGSQPQTRGRNMGIPTVPQTSRGGQRGQSGSRNSVPESLSNPQGFDFSRMSEQEFQTARNLPPIHLNYLTAEAQVRRAEAIQKEVDRRDAPRRLAEERRALIAQQQAESVKYQQQMASQRVQQSAKAEELQSQQTERIAGIRARGTAVTQSLQILGRGGSQAPTAAVTRRGDKPQGARSTSASLRMGSTGNSAGSGANFSV